MDWDKKKCHNQIYFPQGKEAGKTKLQAPHTVLSSFSKMRKKKGYPQTDGSRIKGKIQPLQIISSFMLILTIDCPRLQEDKMVCQPREREREVEMFVMLQIKLRWNSDKSVFYFFFFSPGKNKTLSVKELLVGMGCN
jgi:hypothetical protein